MIYSAQSFPWKLIWLMGLLLGLLPGLSRDVLAQSQGSADLLQLPVPEETATEKTEDQSVEMTVADFIKQGNDAYVEAAYEDAIAAYSKALELFNQNAYAYYNRGNAYRKLNQDEAALQDYSLAIRINPDNYYAYYYRGILLADQKKYEQALTDFTAALALTDQNPLLFERRAEIYLKLDDEKAANEDYRKAIAIYKQQGKDIKADRLQRQIGGLVR